jgi:plastocyanin domain-containing protein
VTIPSLNITSALALNEPVDIDFTPAKGEIEFVCGMSMLKRTVVCALVRSRKQPEG